MIRRPGPLVQLTAALVALCGSLILLADVFFGLLPDREAREAQSRRVVAEALAVQLAALAGQGERALIESTLAEVAQRTPGLRSVGLRTVDGRLLADAGAHGQVWRLEDGQPGRGQLSVPMYAGGDRWGALELAFDADRTNPLLRWLRQPVVILLLFVSLAGALVFALYLRRALLHLDPASVIPERVQQAYDSMSVGLVVLDAGGRVLLANRAFRTLHPQAGALRTGERLSQLVWLAPALTEDADGHPWTRAMVTREVIGGTPLQVPLDGADARQLLVHCSPITDRGRHVRGALVTFDDVSELHRANRSLRETLDALAAAKAEVEARNDELRRLATRDPLTGCLNRRAFHPAFERLAQEASNAGAQISVLMIDIDHFKAVNDTHGHAIGDRVIQEVARKLQECTRSADLVCRYGGEEFCIAAAGLGSTGALQLAERIRARVERECAAGVREIQGLRVTISAGVVTRDADEAGNALIDLADQALYRAKRSGRNRVSAPLGDDDEGQRAQRDADTGCLTRQALQAGFDSRLQEMRGTDAMLGCIVVALDDAELMVQTRGDAECKRALQSIALALRQQAPADALVGRHGEASLCLVAPAAAPELMRQAERIRAAVEDQGLASLAVGGWPLATSIGVAALPASAPGATTLLERGDQARARARRAGGNRVCEFGAPRQPGIEANELSSEDAVEP